MVSTRRVEREAGLIGGGEGSTGVDGGGAGKETGGVVGAEGKSGGGTVFAGAGG